MSTKGIKKQSQSHDQSDNNNSKSPDINFAKKTKNGHQNMNLKNIDLTNIMFDKRIRRSSSNISNSNEKSAQNQKNKNDKIVLKQLFQTEKKIKIENTSNNQTNGQNNQNQRNKQISQQTSDQSLNESTKSKKEIQQQESNNEIINSNTPKKRGRKKKEVQVQQDIIQEESNNKKNGIQNQKNEEKQKNNNKNKNNNNNDTNENEEEEDEEDGDDDEDQDEDDDEDEDEEESNKIPEKRFTRENRGKRTTLEFLYPKNIRGEDEDDFGTRRNKRKNGRGRGRGRKPFKNGSASKLNKSQYGSINGGRLSAQKSQQDTEHISLDQLNRIFKKAKNDNCEVYETSEIFRNNFQQKIYDVENSQEDNEEENDQNQEQNQEEILEIKQQNNLQNEQQLQLNQIDQSQLTELQKSLIQNLNGENINLNKDDQNNNLISVQQKIKKIINTDFQQPDKQSAKNLKELNNKIIQLNQQNFPSQTYLNCDLKYFNMDYLTESFGSFDIIMADPPWRIKGGQGNDSQFMFSNSKFNLEYNTMSNQEIRDLKIEKLSQKGFMFLWILNTQMKTAYEMMGKWGYEVIDQIVWVKLKDKKIYLSHGYYFMHSFEICLVGFKNPQGEHVEYQSKISNNIIFAEVRKKSQKPDEIYELIELLMPGSKKIELFARNHNLRPGWFSLGNQLGELYEKWNQTISCDDCGEQLKPGKTRFKSQIKPDHDLCQDCYEKSEQEDKTKEFLELENKVDEDVLHYYHKCDHCHTEPIWGNRFECQEEDCQQDFCEACLDKNIALKENEKFHDINHKLKVVEVPKFAHGFPVHSLKKCSSCFAKPIIGVCFTCKQCQNFNLCQPCFFGKTPYQLSRGNRGHKPDHKIESIFDPVKEQLKIRFKCNGCQLDNLQGDIYQCENCFGFYFCPKCYFTKRDDFKTMIASSHKNFHQFMKLQIVSTNTINHNTMN